MSKQIDIRVANLDCEHDAGAIERGLEGFPGLIALKICPKAARVTLTYDPERVSPERMRQKLEGLGFPPQEGRQLASPPKPWRNLKVLASVASGLRLLAGWLLGRAGGSDQFSLTIYLAAIAIGGYKFGREDFEDLIFERKVGIRALMELAPKTVAVRRDGREIDVPAEELVPSDIFIVRTR